MKEHEKWIQKAENDLLCIHNNLHAEKIPVDVCCFHAQQAAEKYLKAYLISKLVVFPKTHDLELLIHLCEQKNSAFTELLPVVRRLIDYAIFPRYPDMLDDLTVEDVRIALKDSQQIKQFILQHFLD